MVKRYFIYIILVLTIIGLLFFSGCTQQNTTLPKPNITEVKGTKATVSEVVDGDTIELESNKTIRLLGINTPERGQPYYEEATERLRELIGGKEILLVNDTENKGKYGRLLRYVFLGGENVNVKLVREGLAIVYIIEPNTKYEKELREAEEKAKQEGLNIWKRPEGERVCDNRCIGISYFHENANGNDCDNLNDEYVKFRNTCPYSCNLTGWKVKDESSRDPYVFPKFVLDTNEQVTLYTGCGDNTKKELYWCSSGRACNAIWNNGGDTLFLRNLEGELVLSYSY